MLVFVDVNVMVGVDVSVAVEVGVGVNTRVKVGVGVREGALVGTTVGSISSASGVELLEQADKIKASEMMTTTILFKTPPIGHA